MVKDKSTRLDRRASDRRADRRADSKKKAEQLFGEQIRSHIGACAACEYYKDQRAVTATFEDGKVVNVAAIHCEMANAQVPPMLEVDNCMDCPRIPPELKPKKT